MLEIVHAAVNCPTPSTPPCLAIKARTIYMVPKSTNPVITENKPNLIIMRPS